MSLATDIVYFLYFHSYLSSISSASPGNFPKSIPQRTFKQSLCSAIGYFLFLAEQRAIREELENRCPTLEITYADDDPNCPANNPPTVLPTFRDLLPYVHKPTTVLRPSSSLETASSYFIPPLITTLLLPQAQNIAV